MVESDIKQCPLSEDYLFTTECSINACKYHASAVSSKCLLTSGELVLDRSVTDLDLLTLKFQKEELSEKQVCAKRKQAVERVKMIVQLFRLVSYIKENYVDDSVIESNTIVQAVCTRPPLNIPRLGFEPWMLSYIFDDSIAARVCGPKFKQKTALRLKQKEFIALLDTFRRNKNAA